MSTHKTSWFWRVSRGILVAVIVPLSAATFLPEINTDAWWIRSLSFPRVQFLVALFVLLLLSVALPDRHRGIGLASSTLAAISLVFQCVILFPWTPLAKTQALDAGSCTAGGTLRLFEANIQMTNQHDERLFTEIADSRPDILLLLEVDGWWHDRLARLYAAYPFHSNQPQHNHYGIAMLSRYPLVHPQIVYMAASRDPAIVVGIELPGGDLVQFYGLHPRPPLVGHPSTERDGEIMDTALRMTAAGVGPQILAGDLNATPWSPVVRRLARIAHLLDPRMGRGWFPTWKANSIVLRWPLDQVQFSKFFTLMGFEVLPPFGSDHQPTLTTLCYIAATGPLQQPPERRPDDLTVARNAVLQAQAAASASRTRPLE